MQQDGRGSITSRFRRPPTDQLTSAEAEKVHQEKVQQEKLKEVKARLNFEGCSGKNLPYEMSQHSESRTPNVRGEHRRGRRSGRSRSMSRSPKRTSVFSRIRHDSSESPRHRPVGKGRRDGGVFNRLGGKEKSASTHSESRCQSSRSRRTKSIPRKRHYDGTCSRRTKMLSESEDRDPFTPSIRYFDFPKKTQMPNNVKTYDGSDDPEDHLKIFQAAAKVERWAMLTWCHMFTSTLTGSVRHSSRERWQLLTMYGRKLFRRGSNRKLGENFFERKGDFRNQKRSDQRRDKFTLLIKSPKETLALDKGKFKTTPPMTTPVEKRNNNKFCEFHGEVGHNIDECMHLKIQIKELIKARKLSHVINELKQDSEKDQPKAAKKGETSRKDKPLAILMVQPWQRVARQRITQSFSPNLEISFPPLGDEEGTEGLMIIAAEIRVKNQMVPATVPLIGFSGEIIWPMGQILQLVKIGDAEHSTFTWMNFVVVRSPSSYNGIIGRPGVRKIQAVPSTAHMMLKFPIPGGILTLRRTRIIPLECTMVSGPEAQPCSITQATEERIRVEIHLEYPEQTIAIGSTLTEKGRKALYELLKMPSSQTKEKKPSTRKEQGNTRGSSKTYRCQDNEGSLLPQLVVKSYNGKKHDDSWRMYVHFKDLNKACPKDGYPLLDIDWKPKDILLLQNAFWSEECRATYQRLVDKAFQKQIGRNLKVYMDDLVIKSSTEQEIMRDIKETFRTLREINMKLNPKKCTFGVDEGMFLGYKVNTKGIKVCPDKVEAVLSLPSPKCLKDVQKLNGKLASLNRFLSKSVEKSLPFFKALKKCTKKSDFPCTAEAKAAFKQMKKLIAELPTLPAPMEKEEPIVYLVAAQEAVSAMLMTKREANQMPVYFVSRALQGPEINYTPVEKLVLALVHHPQVNGLAERANRSLGEGIKARLDKRSKDWMEEIPHVLWAHRTMIKSSNGDTPFSLTYKTEAVIPTEIGMPTLRTVKIDMARNDEALEINLDLLEERREQAAICEARSKAKMEKYYNFKVRNTSFKPGDLVYRNNDAIHAKDSGKLVPK
ncbi:reverse transcriptase domain-containing protein [Tanacetum coccineum]